jgi:outer membrane protein TolC
MTRAGNFSRLDQARERLFYAETTAQLARARQIAVSSREKLIRLMGLWGEDIQFKLPSRLSDLPNDRLDLRDVEQIALRDRLDIQAAKIETARLASSLGLTRTTRLVNVLDLGYVRGSQTGLPRETGYEISVEIPLFDWGSARVAKAEAVYMQAIHRVAQQAVNARSEVREAYQGYLTAYDLAKHYRDEIVPLRKKISDENQLRYNGMLISVFELLADAREQMAAVNAYVNALRDFWVAQTDLQSALGGKLLVIPVLAEPPVAPGSAETTKGKHHE